MSVRSDQTVIGRQETADFPEIGLFGVLLKIDTGAFSTAIHCSKIELTETNTLHVIFLEEGETGYTGNELGFKKFEKRKVKSSSGHTELRFAINTKISLGGETYRIRVTLTDRSAMRIPVLVGRKFLKINKFIVDPALKNVFGGD